MTATAAASALGGGVAARAENTGPYRAEFDRLAARRADEPAWLRAARGAAIERFEALGFPGPREEDWRFTNVAPIARAAFRTAPPAPRAATAADVAAATFGPASARIVFVDGHYAPELSAVDAAGSLRVASLREALARDAERLRPVLDREAAEPAPFAALNTALFADGAFVHAPAGTATTEPLHVVFLASGSGSEPSAIYPRLVVLAERASQLTVVESYLGGDGARYFTNAVTDVVAGEGAVVDHYKVQRESTSAFHVGRMTVRQGRAASVSSHSIALGSALARNDVEQVFLAEGGDCTLNGLFLASGTQHLDTHTRLDHAQPHGTSRQLYKGVLDGKARGVFVGRVLVRKGAGKTDAQQTNKNLLLSKEALVDSLPQLEILTDDVKCKHGSTTGQLDPSALFYLRSRGISEAAARSLLVYAFASDVLGGVKVGALREGLERYLQSRLPSPLGADPAGVER
jgi:Fe-S cluster assembly protein SufD